MTWYDMFFEAQADFPCVFVHIYGTLIYWHLDTPSGSDIKGIYILLWSILTQLKMQGIKFS